jgi:hypothetical protein
MDLMCLIGRAPPPFFFFGKRMLGIVSRGKPKFLGQKIRPAKNAVPPGGTPKRVEIFCHKSKAEFGFDCRETIGSLPNAQSSE